MRFAFLSKLTFTAMIIAAVTIIAFPGQALAAAFSRSISCYYDDFSAGTIYSAVGTAYFDKSGTSGVLKQIQANTYWKKDGLARQGREGRVSAKLYYAAISGPTSTVYSFTDYYTTSTGYFNLTPYVKYTASSSLRPMLFVKYKIKMGTAGFYQQCSKTVAAY